MQDGYSICLNRWALDKNIKNELGLLLIISSLCAEKGYCFASNSYLAKEFNITEVSASMKIKKLEEYGYITIEYEKRGCEIISRKIRLKNILTDDLKNIKPTIKKNFKDNNISINNTSINNKYKEPTLEEIQEYIKEKNMNVDAETFYNYFTTSNWIDSKGNKVKNWKQKLITWNSYGKKKENTPSWFKKEIKDEKLSKSELKEMEELMKDFK